MAQLDPQGEANVMSSGEEVQGTPKHHPGTCHRCGWHGPVTKVARRDRKRLHSGKAYGRLCDECVNDLLRQKTEPHGTQSTGRAKLKAVIDRDVA
jgi:hypothetical protein